MNRHDQQYHNAIQHVLEHGVTKTDRTGTGTRSVFGYQMRFDLRDWTVPLITSKKMYVRAIIRELLWYIAGGTNNNDLRANNVTIWDEWARPDGDLGPVYGYQWRKWPGKPELKVVRATAGSLDQAPIDLAVRIYQPAIDQLAQLIDNLKKNPDGRRLIVSAWNVADLPDMALPPCHYLFQCYTRDASMFYRILWAKKKNILSNVDYINNTTEEINAMLDDLGVPKKELSLMLNQRSADVGLGVPFNIIQYSLLLRMLAEVCHYVPGDFIWSGGDVHIYSNHETQLREQLTRSSFAAPEFSFARPVDHIDDFGYDDFIFSGYQSHPSIKMDVAI